MTPPVVTYDEGPPRKYTVNGVPVPSVTQILGVLDKPALVWWGMTTGIEGICTLARAGEPLDWQNPPALTKLLTEHKLTVNHVRDSAATRGQSVHAALQAWADASTIPKLSDFPAEDRGYVQALAAFLVDHDPEPLATEVVVGSAEHSYAGRYDLRCRVADREGILDVKTSKGLYDPVHLQLAGYDLADIEGGADLCEMTWALRLGADGAFELVEGRGTHEQFLAVRDAYAAVQSLKASRPRKRRVAA